MNNLKTRMTSVGVLVIEIDVPNSNENILNEDLSKELYNLFKLLPSELNLNKWHGTIIKSRKLGSFIAGADINWIESVNDSLKAKSLSLMAQRGFLEIEKSERPVVAAILGTCMGGGLELALACHCRIAVDHDKTIFSLPEVKLGLLPGGGGTQRAPKVMGIVNAVDFIVKGLVDHVIERLLNVDESLEKLDWELERKAVEIVLGMRLCVMKIERPFHLTDYFLSFPFFWNIYEQKVCNEIEKKTMGKYPAPLKALEAIKTGHLYGKKKGYQMEAANFGYLVTSKESKALIHVFNLVKNMKKQIKFIPEYLKSMKIALYGGSRALNLLKIIPKTCLVKKFSHLEVNNQLNDFDIIVIMPDDYCTDTKVLVRDILKIFEKDTKIPILIDGISFPEDIIYNNLFLTRLVEPYNTTLHVEIVKQNNSESNSIKIATTFFNLINKCVTITTRSVDGISGFVNNCLLALVQGVEEIIKSILSKQERKLVVIQQLVLSSNYVSPNPDFTKLLSSITSETTCLNITSVIKGVAKKLIQENSIDTNMKDCDFASLFSLGYPPYLGGLFFN
ncbi:Mitochondrial trifunctional protein alpha subunit [Strongyloides ratti]|uniref:enoyl-CoA hydratase n=1 Tax=Strongyloides ratti TaxID=34506 RepID=A0A090L7E2_STRRB|nr:Mitochondrial trifunctional protein alpha subunit [Strongyloides ratti]CEF63439.1 Mitochondrial trifunctional protein alpha subunit [Strongyloides ratti]